MTALSISAPFPIFTDIDGQPLEAGYIWIGVANLAPIGNPINVYWDAALTLPAAQPIRTIGGYPVNAGTPARLYVNSDYSIQVQNRNGSVLYSAPDGATDRFSAAQISFVQAGSGAVTRTAQSKMRDIVSVLDFGADPTGVADSTVAIQTAINYAASAGAELNARGIFKITSKIVIKCDADFSDAEIRTDGSLPVAVEISTGSATNPADTLIGKRIVMGKLFNTSKSPGGGWGSYGVGLRVVNVVNSDIDPGHIRGFSAGLLMTAYSNQGTAYNTLNIGYFENNKINLLVMPGDATQSFVNENLYIGGRYHYRSEEGTQVAGTRQIALMPFDTSNASLPWPNQHVFLAPSLEGNVPEYTVEIAGNNNAILNGRWEVFSPLTAARVLFTGHPSVTTRNLRNVISGGYQADTIEFDFSGVGLWGDLISQRKIVHSGFGLNDIVRNTGGDVSTTPTRRVFRSTKEVLAALTTDTDWVINEYAEGIEFKRNTDAFPRVKIDFLTGFVYFGLGAANPTIYIGETAANPGALSVSDDIWPVTNATHWLGQSGLRWQRVYQDQSYVNEGIYFGDTFTGNPWIKKGTGTPEANIVAPVGSLFLRTDGGAGTTLYVKESGTGSIGWVAK